ncbi:MAG: tRNA pseudouridine(13) synthase TruD [Planctomycetes bacterium]|nr:tRNA pseudouridine(13) synthase TruD [Planctomycetota bacterium]
MRLKERPGDFRVEEVYDFEADPAGSFWVYRLEKRRLTTLEAIHRASSLLDVPRRNIAVAGLKDRQAETAQHLSVRVGRAPPPARIAGGGLVLVRLGRAREPVRSAAMLGNRFRLVVRDLASAEVAALPGALADLRRDGFPNYYDDQRFGSVRAGQGFPARDLVAGDTESALRRALVAPRPARGGGRGRRCPRARRDPEALWQALLVRHWGDWEALAARGLRNVPHAAALRHLARHPHDHAGAFARLEPHLKALHVFAYQAYVWNETAAAYLRTRVPGGFERPYACGRLYLPGPLDAARRADLAGRSVPVIDHRTRVADPILAGCLDRVLAREGLTVSRFRIDGVPGTFFREESRALMVRPRRLRAGPPRPDMERRGRQVLSLEFELPPGSYATVVVSRLFPSAHTH